MVSFEGSSVQIALPDFSTLGTWDWIVLFLVCNAIYGLFTHWVSLPAIKRYNRALSAENCSRNRLGSGMLVGALLSRMTVQLPLRIIALILGLLFWGVGLIASFESSTNEFLQFGWEWHYDPENLRK